MVYKVIGLMSGSSLDGLDIAYVVLEEIRGKWSFEILAADCIPYSDEWRNALKHAGAMQATDFLKLHTRYGRYTGEFVNAFIAKHNLHHQVHFIVSHGHTIMHEPQQFTTFQIGDGAAIAAVTGLHVINDLRSADVALGGQGAPIVPIGDRLLFADYDYCLNIGGIANISIQNSNTILAYDVCPANQILNALAETQGKMMDENGDMAAQGTLIYDVLDELNNDNYYKQPPPKSLSNEATVNMIFPKFMQNVQSVNDLLHTMVIHIAQQVAAATNKHPHQKPEGSKMLITGGGAFNAFLVSEIKKHLAPTNIAITVPAQDVVKYKEALVMALIGALRWRGEANVLSSVTGASRDSSGGAMWSL